MTKMMRAMKRLALAAGFVGGFGKLAYAQSMNYEALEQLFGEPVTTSATGSPQRASDVPSDMEIITRDQIRRSGADNIPDILRFVAGLDVRTYGIATAQIAVRGYSQPPNPRLLVMVNGRQIYFDDYGYVDWSTLPVQLDEIRQIELVKGPNSALFGFNAASGVINIITDGPLTDDVRVATIRAGTQGLAEGSVVTTFHPTETIGVRLSAGGFSARDFAPIGLSADDVFFRRDPRHGAINGEVRWKAAPNIELMAEGSYVYSRTPEDLGGIYFDMRYRVNSFRVGGTADTDVGLITVDAYGNDAHMLYHSVLLGNEPVDDEVWVAKANDLLKLGGDSTLRLGVEFRDNSASGRDFGGRVGYNVYAADAMLSWQAAPALTFTNAVRIDYLNLRYNGVLVPGSGLTLAQYNRASITAISFNSGFVWKPSDIDTVRLTAARGLQAPSLDDFGVQLQVDPPSLGNPNLAPTYVWNASLGYDRRVTEWSSTLRTTLLAQRNENLLGSNWFANPTVLPSGLFASQALNIGSSDEVGVEIGVRGASSTGWHWNASYSFAAVSDRIDPAAANLAFSYKHAAPQHIVIVGAGYSFGRWEMDATARWQSRYQDYHFDTEAFVYSPVPVSPYATVTARVGYRVLDDLTLAVSGVQLTRLRQQQTEGPPVERRILGTASFSF